MSRWRELVIDRKKWRGIVQLAKAHSGLTREQKKNNFQIFSQNLPHNFSLLCGHMYDQETVSTNQLPGFFHILSYPVLLLSFNVLPTHFTPFIPHKNIPTFSHRHKPLPKSAVHSHFCLNLPKI
jgi:hypothetical protein